MSANPPPADELFAQALDLPEDQRGAFIAARCDGPLRDEVMSLLAHVATAGAGFMRPGMPSATIGHYRLLRPLGQGGFGAVYLAQQDVPVKRLVALKLLHAGLSAQDIVARFEAERQALAVMDHPGIAKVFDAGAAPDGRPYFVMEYVRGTPITTYCKDHSLTRPEVLQLFTQVCDAVQHAHMKGVIHRDIKASNVLVSDGDNSNAERGTRNAEAPSSVSAVRVPRSAFPRVIDFGIAKATQAPLTDRTLITQRGELMGTPEYMSPEQASGLDVDTRADVYSLGVLLYELLCGTLPFQPKDIRSKSMGEIERTIREVEPPRPSARASDPSLAGELDWIVMRCLEKERSRRYATPAEIAADIQRLLRHEPVTARPPSSAYRLRKFARRNRLVLSAGALLAIALFAGATVSTLGFMQAARQRDDAEHRGKISAGVVGYVTNELLRQADPSVSGGHDITVKDVLKNADATIAEQFHDEPLVEAGIRLTVGEMERTLSDYALAEKHLQRAVDLCMASLGPDHADTVTAQRELAVMYDDQGRNEQAADLFAIVLQKRTALFGERDSRTLQAAGDLAIAYTNSGRYADAERLLLRIFEARLAAGGPDDVSTLLVENNLAVNLWYQGRYDEAFTHAQHAYDGYRAKKGPDHRVSLAAANSLGIIELRRGNLSHAHALLLENLDRRRRVLGNDSPDVASSLSNLAECLLEEDAPANAVAAEVMLRESLALRQRQLPAGHWTISNVKSLLGQALASQQHFSEAQPLLLAGYEGLMSSSQTPPGRAQRAAARLAHCFRAMGDASLSEQWEAKAAADRH